MALGDTVVVYNNTTSVIDVAIADEVIKDSAVVEYVSSQNSQVTGTPYMWTTLLEASLTNFTNYNDLKGRKLNTARTGILDVVAKTESEQNTAKVNERKAIARRWINDTLGSKEYAYYRNLVAGFGDDGGETSTNKFTALEAIAEMCAIAVATDSNLTDDSKWNEIKTIFNYSLREWYKSMATAWYGEGIDLKTQFRKAVRVNTVIQPTVVSSVSMSGAVNMANFVIYGG